jgi:cellobiose epimerase
MAALAPPRIVVLLILLPALAACASRYPVAAGAERVVAERVLADEIAAELRTKLNVWYPRVIDREHGGFLTDFAYDWRLTDNQDKMIVTQSRHLWTLSKLAERFPQHPEYAAFARHGFEFLRDRMWDAEYGGFFQLTRRDGTPVPAPAAGADADPFPKTLYGNAFAIYGLAAYYGYSRDPEVLDLARRAFHWLETHAHDPVHGGYFQPLARDGTPTRTGYPKDYNSGIHILEALAELYSVQPDPLVRERLAEMFYIIRDTVTSEEGYLRLYFTADWTPLSLRDSSEAFIRENSARDHVSPGHDIETAFLLLEAAHVLSMGDDPQTHRVARRMTDHALEVGWDPETGGLFDAAYYFRDDDHATILSRTKAWWAQAEALHTLAIMARLYPEDPRYFRKLTAQWRHIQQYLVDPEHGGWYPNSLDTAPARRTGSKSQIWKGNYHTVRSLLGALDQLRREGAAEASTHSLPGPPYGHHGFR